MGFQAELRGEAFRGSVFRGVSRNGTKWQVLIEVRKAKRYLGQFRSEELAARQYDKYAVLLRGLKVNPRGFTCRRERIFLTQRKKFARSCSSMLQELILEDAKFN